MNVGRIASWLDGHAVDPQSMDRLPQDVLDGIAASRLIFLGEANHFVHEKADFRLWWLERLYREFDLVLAEELGRTDAFRISRYLEGGGEEWLDRVPTFGFRDEDRTDRSDVPTGIFRASFEAYPTALFKAEQSRFYRGLRRLSPALRVTGIDLDGGLGSAYADIEAKLQAMGTALADRTRAEMTLVPGESAAEEAVRLESVRASLPDDAGWDEIREDLFVAAETLDFVASAYPAPSYEELRPAMARREEMMKRQAVKILDALRPSQKLVIMAHAFHLCRDDGRLVSGGGVGPGGDTTSSLGHHLVREIGEKAYAIWMLYGAGRDSQPYPDLPNVVDYPADTINMAMHRRGRAELLAETRHLPEETRVKVGHMYDGVVEADIGAQADVVHFWREVSPLRAG